MGEITYPINEIFRSIQGEGYNAGRMAVFIRLAGCNLSCPWCDTDHSLKETLDPVEVQRRLREISRPWDLTVITGGEPTIHNIIPLIGLCRNIGIIPQVAIETNGVKWEVLKEIKEKSPRTWITVSPKPGHIVRESFQYADEIKVVWDKDHALDLLAEMAPHESILMKTRLYLQPCSEKVAPALRYVEEHPWWRLSLQIHKMIGAR